MGILPKSPRKHIPTEPQVRARPLPKAPEPVGATHASPLQGAIHTKSDGVLGIVPGGASVAFERYEEQEELAETNTMVIAIDTTLVLLTLAGFLYAIVIGVVLKRHGLRGWATRLLILYLVASLLWTAVQALSWLDWPTPFADTVLTRGTRYGLLLLSLLFLHLSRLFLRLEGVGWKWWGLGAVWLAVLIVLDSIPAAMFPMTLVSFTGPVQRQVFGLGALIVGWGSFISGVAFLTIRSYHRAQQPLHKNRIMWWFPALGFTIAGAVLFFTGHKAPGSGFQLLGALSTTYAMLTYHLPDVRQMARRTVSYLIITLLTVALYTTGFLVTQYIFQSVPGYSPLVVGAGMALVLAILFDPLLGLVQRLVNRVISGPRYDPSHMLREYSMSISNILDLEQLAMVAVGLIGEAMAVRRGALFVVDYEKGQGGGEGGRGQGNGHFRLRSVGGLGDGIPSGALGFDSPVANYLRLKQHPLTQYDIDLLPHFQETSPAERAWLDRLDMDVYVPIYSKGRWIGLLALGPKTSGDRYFEGDLTLLSTLADQTAVALENARLFEDLKIRNAENERLNEELTAANRELARLDQAKSDFIDIASHELRTPLTQVYGCNDVLRAMIEDGSLTRDVGLQLTQNVGKAARRLKEIVDIMLDVSRLDTETLVLDLAPVSVASVVNGAADRWAEALEERKQTLTIENLRNLPSIVADGERLQQVFSHLIQNAIKYTPDGGQIRILGRLRGEGMLPQEQSIEIIVADTGIGIAPDDLERIFDKFYRVGDIMSHSTGETKFKGAGPGLGLAIARGIVEAHGGRIWAESPGCQKGIYAGSEFHVILHVRPPHLVSMGSGAPATIAEAEVKSGGEPPSVY